MTTFNYFLKTLHLKSFRGIWISVSGSNYVRFLNIPELSICMGPEFLRLQRVYYFLNYDKILNGRRDAIKEGSEYSRIQNMPSFCICESYTRSWICLSKPEYSLIMLQYVLICLKIRPSPSKKIGFISFNKTL